MRNSTKVLVSIVMTASLLLPAFSQAASLTADQINSVINLLQSFNVDSHTVDTVRAVLTHTEPPQSADNDGTSTPPGQFIPPGQLGKAACVTLLRNLGPGSRGGDVRDLQQMLKEDPESGFTGSTTGFYGALTARAMARFQENNGIASTTSGFVGPLTRGFFERRCGKGLDNAREFGTTTMDRENGRNGGNR